VHNISSAIVSFLSSSERDLYVKGIREFNNDLFDI